MHLATSRIFGMKPFVFLVVIVVVCSPSFVLTDSGLRGPPHIVGDMIPKYFAKVGDTIRLDCPIESNLPTAVLYEWLKDGEAIKPGWDRFQTGKSPRKLRIKDVVAEDGGQYVCKAVNGFGSKELSTRLVVHDASGAIVGGFEEEVVVEEERSLDKVSGMRPTILEVTQPTSGNTFRQILGSSLTLRCKVDGQPFPSVSWFRIKNGIQLSRVNGQQLDLTYIKSTDNGTYVCRADNIYGSVNASFTLEVIDRGMKGPRIISLEPSNLTVARGQLIHFRCLISSDTVPSIQWLRELSEQETEAEDVKILEGIRYKVISSANRAVPMQNGSYLSELKLQANGSQNPGGTSYMCLASNSGGDALQKSFLSILPVFAVEESDPLLPIGVLIAIPCTLMILFTGLALVICCVRRSQSGESSAPPTVTTNTTYATPRDATNDYQTPPHPFYNPRPQLRNGRDGPPSAPHILPISTQPYFTKDNMSSAALAKGHVHVPHLASPAYASVPICETVGVVNNTSSFGLNNRAPPLPSRPNFNPSTRDRNNYNNQGLLTQPLLTQTASSSDSRDSRQSASHRAEFTNPRPIDHWCSSGGSDASSERKHARNHQIRL